MELEQESIVVVEDDLAHRSLIRSVLASEGFKVYCAADGEGGLDLVRGVIPALLITDVMLPGFDGLELCRRSRSDPATALVPVIFISARSSPQDLQEAVNLGADDYLPKPFKLGELLERVRVVLKRTRKQRDKMGAAASEKKNPPPPDAAFRSDLLLGGQLDAVGVIELLRTIDVEHLSARLEIKSVGQAVLEFREGHLLHARISTRKGQVFGLKAWLRITSWQEGTFQLLEIPEDAPLPEFNVPDEPLPSLLVEAAFHRDDLAALRKEFAESNFLYRKKGLPSDISPVESQIWQSVGQGIYLEALLDDMPLKDVEILQGVLQLKQRGVLVSS